MARKGSVFLMASVLTLVLGAVGAQPALAAKAELKNEDCGKCHEQQAADLDAAGLAHKDQGCRECHKAHRPASKNNIPVCSDCHSGEPHFKLANCLGCHKNPHTPRKVTFTKGLTEPCQTCHVDKAGYVSPATQLRQFPSKHSEKACSFCHDVHRKKPECTQCHKPHAEFMAAKDCLTCHKPHQPKNVTYPATVGNSFCGACHKKPAALIAATETRHAKVACVQCHKDKHKMVPKCLDCHKDGGGAVAMKHPAGIMKKFPNCLTCHNHPHDLNNFAMAKAAAPAAAAPAPAAK
jgi:predicted CXXCH cytochrome family protein